MRQRTTRTWCLLLGLAVVHLGCATGYGAAGRRGGYSETRVGPDLFRVFFAEQGFTSEERANDMVMLRAAELTLAHGFRHFVVLADNRSLDSSESIGGPVGGGVTLGLTVARDSTYVSTIRCYLEPPEGAETLDAQVVFDDLTAKYEIDRDAPAR